MHFQVDISSKICNRQLYIREDGEYSPSLDLSQRHRTVFLDREATGSESSFDSAINPSNTSDPIPELKGERVSTPDDDEPITPRNDTPTCIYGDTGSSSIGQLPSTSDRQRKCDGHEADSEAPETMTAQCEIVPLRTSGGSSWSNAMETDQVS